MYQDGVKTGVLLPHEVVTKSRKLRPESPETTPMDVVEVIFLFALIFVTGANSMIV